MSTKLELYNEALGLLGERRLTSLTEARDHRYHLDDAYAKALEYCLEQGYWNFAMRTVTITPSSSITVAFGYTRAYEKPTDWVRSYILSASPSLDPPLLDRQYVDEADIWYADCNPLYVKYVSNDATTYGAVLANWPETYAFYVACRLARMICPIVSSGSADKIEQAEEREKKARLDARNKDAMNEPTKFPPRGSWSQSRMGRSARPRSETLGY